MDAGNPGGNDAGKTPTACSPSAAPTVPSLGLRSVFSGLDRLVFAAQPKGTTDWYLVRQSGQILVSKNGAPPSSTPFLDVSSQINLDDLGNEFGLLGLAFPPDYATSGKLYVTLTPSGGDPNEWEDQVIEYQRSAADPYRVDPASKRVLLSLERSSANHNGGHVVFGPDGKLYVGTGDGGGSCNDDKRGAPQDKSALFGKILRLDPALPAPHAAAGNPFSGASGDARVLHYGLRNPYRFNFDFETGQLYIGDVGQNTAEEIDVALPGAQGLNFGWPAHEGKASGTCSGSLAAGSEHTPPILDANRKDMPPGKFSDYLSIIAGPVYHGAAIPSLQGAFIFGDYEGDRMGVLRQCGAQTSPVTIIRKRKDANSGEAGFAAPQGEAFARLTAIVEDSAGELYFVANQNSLLKVEPAP